jgi:xylulokinase
MPTRGSAREVLVGVDVGTTGLKAVAVDFHGRLLRERAVRYPTRVAGPGAEQDAEAWWAAAREALPPVVAGDAVAGVAVTCQAPTLVALDARGEPRGPALTWIDRRAAAEARELEAAIGPGRNVADPYFATAKLLWWRRNRTDLEKAAVVLGATGFLVRRLTGEDTLDDSSAGLHQGWDGGFDPALVDAGVPLELLPEAVPCAQVVGRVSHGAAGATGLPAGSPVAAGAIDSVGAALEAGVLAPDDPVVEMTGFSSVTVQAVPRGTTVPGMIHTRHCVPGLDLLLTAQVTTGAVVDWLCGLTGSRDLLDHPERLPRERPGRVLLMPALAGERTPTWDAHARGAVLGLDLGVGAEELLLAVFEGTALALRDDLERVARATGQAGPVRASGGGAKSPVWLQVKADVLGRPVEVPLRGHGAAVGAALLAGLAVGAWPDAEALREPGDPVAARFEPDPERHAAYSARFEVFRRLRAALPDYTRALEPLTPAPTPAAPAAAPGAPA